MGKFFNLLYVSALHLRRSSIGYRLGNGRAAAGPKTLGFEPRLVFCTEAQQLQSQLDALVAGLEATATQQDCSVQSSGVTLRPLVSLAKPLKLKALAWGP